MDPGADATNNEEAWVSTNCFFQAATRRTKRRVSTSSAHLDHRINQ
jgi:hypothetical protein